MEIKIQLDKNLLLEEVIGTLVCEEDSDVIIGEIILYDSLSGISTCKLYDKDKKNEV